MVWHSGNGMFARSCRAREKDVAFYANLIYGKTEKQFREIEK